MPRAASPVTNTSAAKQSSRIQPPACICALSHTPFSHCHHRTQQVIAPPSSPPPTAVTTTSSHAKRRGSAGEREAATALAAAAAVAHSSKRRGSVGDSAKPPPPAGAPSSSASSAHSSSSHKKSSEKSSAVAAGSSAAATSSAPSSGRKPSPPSGTPAANAATAAALLADKMQTYNTPPPEALPDYYDLRAAEMPPSYDSYKQHPPVAKPVGGSRPAPPTGIPPAATVVATTTTTAVAPVATDAATSADKAWAELFPTSPKSVPLETFRSAVMGHLKVHMFDLPDDVPPSAWRRALDKEMLVIDFDGDGQVDTFEFRGRMRGAPCVVAWLASIARALPLQ